MTKPDLKIIEGGRVESVTYPEKHEFLCWKCSAPCIMYPRGKPVGVQHSLPACGAWEDVEKKRDDIERFLIRSGVELLIPQGTA